MRGLVGGLILCLFISQAKAQGITVWNDPGGMIIRYSLQVQKAKLRGVTVRIRGYCGSACTLWLSMPRENLCLYPGAVFVFHAAHSSQRYADRGTEYLWDQYPNWVRRWINANGGLTQRDLIMPYSYSSKFVRRC